MGKYAYVDALRAEATQADNTDWIKWCDKADAGDEKARDWCYRMSLRPITHCEIPTDDREAVRLLRDLYGKVQYQKGAYHPDDDRARTKLKCACDFAEYLGGDSLRSLVQCLQRVVASYQITGTDSCPWSLLFECSAFNGGLIFHYSDRTWSLNS